MVYYYENHIQIAKIMSKFDEQSFEELEKIVNWIDWFGPLLLVADRLKPHTLLISLLVRNGQFSKVQKLIE